MEVLPIVVLLGVGAALGAAAARLALGTRPGSGSGERATMAPRPRPRDGAGPPEPSPGRPLDPAEDLLPVGVVRFQERRVAAANAAAHALLDRPPGSLVGRTPMETFLDARLEETLAGLWRAGPGSGAVGELRPAEGRTIGVRAARLDGGELLVILEDVSELRRLRQIRSEFIDNLGHELRTPLATVSLLAEALARDAEDEDLPARVRDRISTIEVETGHLVQMVSELLDLARIEGGSRLEPHDDVDLGALARASAERLRPFAERQGVRVQVTAAPGVPVVRGDQARLGQVLLNLLHNAVKFSPDGGEVEVRVLASADEVLVEVEDRGIGIAAADRPRVFERFFKADRARVRGGGTGLGLSIARHVVEGHGGRIWLDSEPGRGSTFRFAIPTAGRPAPPAADTPRA